MTTLDQIPPEQLAILRGEDQSQLTKDIVIAFTIISFISVCLRVFTRLRYKAVGREDYTIVLAMIFTLLTGILQILQANAGNGKHTVFIPYPHGVEKMLKFLFFSIITYNFSLTFIKVSIILQYQRIFAVREMRIPLQIAMGICVAWGITTFFTSTFSCVPVNAYWSVSERPNARCTKEQTVWFANASINIFTDLMVATLPVKPLWGLQIPKRQKIALVGILTIGWFVCVVSILRLNALVVFTSHPEDPVYYSAATAYWSAIEINLGIVCASLPALKPLVVKIIPGFSTRHSSRGYGTALSGNMSRNHGLASKAVRDTHDADMELGKKSINANAYSSKTDQDTLGKSIYVTQHFEQHFEENGQGSDSESQKDLVASTKFPLPYGKL
ncbi:hypothetical protein CC86DRAFT_351203 [Ophiobolus disseminans]|uniref:Rhodopsin domain-containing protein n=1 Tax=Ophiobolus disseminans TaxID=1469910 RepID=A0A6A7A083_9PLEO|nr:hypothetical protein CC86DRAFT_351203 [Ophiobolus disseminans]